MKQGATLAVRVNAEEVRKLDQLARGLGVNRSAVLRRLINGARIIPTVVVEEFGDGRE